MPDPLPSGRSLRTTLLLDEEEKVGCRRAGYVSVNAANLENSGTKIKNQILAAF